MKVEYVRQPAGDKAVPRACHGERVVVLERTPELRGRDVQRGRLLSSQGVHGEHKLGHRFGAWGRTSVDMTPT